MQWSVPLVHTNNTQLTGFIICDTLLARGIYIADALLTFLRRSLWFYSSLLKGKFYDKITADFLPRKYNCNLFLISIKTLKFETTIISVSSRLGDVLRA